MNKEACYLWLSAWMDKNRWKIIFFKAKSLINYLWHVAEYRRVIIRFCTLLFLFISGIILQTVYYGSFKTKVDVSSFQETFQKKETFANQTINKIKDQISKNGLESLYSDENLYVSSQNEDVAFHVYKGDVLQFWTNNSIDLPGISDFSFDTKFFYQTNNAYVVVIQSFFKQYRCIALIKIKDAVYPKQNSKNNIFAKGFDLPGNIILSEKQVLNSDPVSAKDGKYMFSIVRMPIYEANVPLFVIIFLYWLFIIFYLFKFMDYLLKMDFIKTQRQRLFMLGGVSCLLLLLFTIISVAQAPQILFDVHSFLDINYASSITSTAEHLFLAIIFLFGFYFIIKRNFTIQFSIKSFSKLKTFFFTLGIKTLSFLIFILFYLFCLSLIYDSNMNVAVPYMQELNFTTFYALLLIAFLAYLCYAFYIRLRDIYAYKGNTRNILCSQLIIIILILPFYIIYGETIDVLLFAFLCAIVLFIDLYNIYFQPNTFLYTTLLAFFSINFIVALTYWHCELKNDIKFQTMAENISMRNCIREDAIAETILKNKDTYIQNDKTLEQLVCSQDSQKVEKIERYLMDSYLKIFDEKYSIQVQICDPKQMLYIRKNNFEEIPVYSFQNTKKKFIQLEKSNFYLNTEESYAISFLGVYPFPQCTLYLKLYLKPSYDRMSFMEQQALRKENKSDVSSAKYRGNELRYSNGDFRYPSLNTWMPKRYGIQTLKFSSNNYSHYVYFFNDRQDSAVVSVPERKSYLYVILVTYLFASYLVIALLYFSFYGLKKNMFSSGRKRSLLTRMQTIFVVPILLSFVVLGMITFPFFLNQYQLSQYADLRNKGLSVQQNVQKLIKGSSSLDNQSAELDKLLKELSNLFQLDILLYSENGQLVATSRPLFTSIEKRKSKLVDPKIKFTKNTELYLEEKRGDIDYFSHYLVAYNNKNERVGYINLLSYQAYYHVKSEMSNVLVVIIDVYLFITMLSISIIWLLNRKTTKPLSLLTERIKEIRLTGENSLVEYKSDDEIGELVSQYNSMVLQLMESAEKLAKSEREFAWREMARRIAHEIKNPLTPMKLTVQQCLRKRSMDPDHFDEYFDKTCSILIDQIDNLSNIASEFSSFAKATETKAVIRMNIVEKLQSAVSLFENNPEEVLFTLELNGYEQEYVMMDDKQILQVFNNLFRNAIQAIPEDKKGLVAVSFYTNDGFVFIEIKDNGCGIPDSNKKSMFSPNFTTKTSGMGLGLAIVKNILTNANGDVWFESKVGEGTTFFLRIPLC